MSYLANLALETGCSNNLLTTLNTVEKMSTIRSSRRNSQTVPRQNCYRDEKKLPFIQNEISVNKAKNSRSWQCKNLRVIKQEGEADKVFSNIIRSYHDSCGKRLSCPANARKYKNIMCDNKVLRGTTVTHHPHYSEKDKAESESAKLARIKKRNMALRKAESDAARDVRLKIGTPPPVKGRRHEDVQTELYLEEIFDHPMTKNVAAQTALFHDRPDTPPFVPAKIGMDVATEILPGELFDFNVEVRPILEVLVGATMEQAIIELLEEDQLASLRESQRRHREISAAEKAEYERLEEEETRKRLEKERRIADHIRACELQKETEERVAAAILTTGYIADLLPSVLEGLKMSGYLKDDIKEDLEEHFLKWLMSEVTQEMKKVVDNRDILSEIVKEVLEKTAAQYAQLNNDDNLESDKISLKSGNEESIKDEENRRSNESDERRNSSNVEIARSV